VIGSGVLLDGVLGAAEVLPHLTAHELLAGHLQIAGEKRRGRPLANPRRQNLVQERFAAPSACEDADQFTRLDASGRAV
jgi:hypothetical protein